MCRYTWIRNGIAALICIVPQCVFAQHFWAIHEGKVALTAEFVHATVLLDHPAERVEGYKKYSSVLHLGARWEVTPQVTLRGEFPLDIQYRTDPDADRWYSTKWHVDSTVKGISGDIPGNPSVGVEYFLPESDFALEANVWIPFFSDDANTLDVFASTLGFYSDIERIGTFARKGLPLSAACSWHPQIGNSEHRFLLRGCAGTAENFYTQINAGLDIHFSNMTFRGGYTLATIFHESNSVTFSQAGLSACIDIGWVTPGIVARIPVGNELASHIDAAYNFYVTLRFPD